MTPQSVDSVGAERRLVEEFYNLPVHANPGLILAPLLCLLDEMCGRLVESAFTGHKD